MLILKATLEYPQKYGKREQGAGSRDQENRDWRLGEDQITSAPPGGQIPLFPEAPISNLQPPTSNPLLAAVKYWGNWVLEEARKELAEFYPPDPDGAIPVGYIWARTIPCQNPACGAEIPLMRSFWLAKKDKKRVALYPMVERGERPAVRFHIVGDGYELWPEGFSPEEGTISNAVATCPLCKSVVDNETTHRLFWEGIAGQRLVATAYSGSSGKNYRIATANDIEAFQQAVLALEEHRRVLMHKWGMDPIPDELIHTPNGEEYEPGGFSWKFAPVLLYGMTRWRDLFNARQKLSLIVFAEKIRRVYDALCQDGDLELAATVTTYLALVLSRHSSYNASLCWWEPLGERGFNVFGRQALPMVFDYAEQNPFGSLTGNWATQLDISAEILDHLSKVCQTSTQIPIPTVTQSSATSLPYADNYFDAILTDPPYYDNVPYADLADFFYVWLKRGIGHLYPDLFSTPQTPKSLEVIADLPLLRGMAKTKATEAIRSIKTSEHFEQMLKLSFQEAYRVLKPDGIAVIVYAHKSTTGWETVINALLDSGLVTTGAWPLNTEMQTRLRASESAALASSIYVVARKMARQPTGFYNDVRAELRAHLEAKLHRLWEEGIGGADFFIAAIGSAIEVFGKYERVMDYEGNTVRADRLLDEVRTIATDYAVRQILRDGFAGEVSDLTRLYVLWRWNYGEALVPFDEARKLAQSCGVDLAREWGRGGFVRKEKEFVRVLGPQQRKWDESASQRISDGRSQSKSLTRSIADSHEMIDVLHYAAISLKTHGINWNLSRVVHIGDVESPTG